MTLQKIMTELCTLSFLSNNILKHNCSVAHKCNTITMKNVDVESPLEGQLTHEDILRQIKQESLHFTDDTEPETGVCWTCCEGFQ